MIKIILTYFIERIKFKFAIHKLSKDSVWSVEFIIYLLKKLSLKENRSISWTREYYNKEGILVSKDVITANEKRPIDLKQQEDDHSKDTESQILNSLYSNYLGHKDAY